MQTKCPTCDTQYKYKHENEGRIAQCKKCDSAFVLTAFEHKNEWVVTPPQPIPPPVPQAPQAAPAPPVPQQAIPPQPAPAQPFPPQPAPPPTPDRPSRSQIDNFIDKGASALKETVSTISTLKDRFASKQIICPHCGKMIETSAYPKNSQGVNELPPPPQASPTHAQMKIQPGPNAARQDMSLGRKSLGAKIIFIATLAALLSHALPWVHLADTFTEIGFQRTYCLFLLGYLYPLYCAIRGRDIHLVAGLISAALPIALCP